jgi:ParB-like chromosome segregation protein Spo0J
MSDKPDHPTRYPIAELLNSGVQPLEDWTAEELAALGKAIGRGQLAIPVSISSDGLLLDGHQRLKAMLAQGRKTIDADDVRVIPQATAENALEWSVELNVRRRHLSVAEKADLARKLQRQRRWSQRKIAKVFGVTQPAVNQWLRNIEAATDEEQPTFVVGEDGKTYYAAAGPRAERPMRQPWSPDGHAFKAIHKAVRVLQSEELAGIQANPLQLAKLAQEISDLIEAAEELQNQIQEES